MRHLMGSRFFFHGMPGFTPHDTDFIEILDTNEFKTKRVIRGQGKDIIQLRRKPKKLIIEDALKEKLALCVGKFLIPGFNKEIDFTIDDLPKLQPLIDRLDSKHKYEEIIYNSYIENGRFELTDEQLQKAYQSYLQSRKK